MCDVVSPSPRWERGRSRLGPPPLNAPLSTVYVVQFVRHSRRSKSTCWTVRSCKVHRPPTTSTCTWSRRPKKTGTAVIVVGSLCSRRLSRGETAWCLVRCSRNGITHINNVTLHQTRLVPGLLTTFGGTATLVFFRSR